MAPEGWPFVLMPVCLALVAAAVGWRSIAVVLILVAIFVAFFFRNPDRSCSLADDVICSPADGKVIWVGPALEGNAPDGLPLQISVFMSVFNVHVNRAPMNGTLTDCRYNPGRTMAAFKDKASLENEQNLSIWRGPAGEVAVKQIAGLIARRIVFDHQPGDAVRRGDRIGLIRFGSRVDVFLPAGTELLVNDGDRVHAGETGLARLVAP